MICEERLRELGFLICKKRGGSLITIYNNLMREYGEDGAGFFSKLYRVRMKRNGHKVGHSKFQDGISKSFFSVVIQVLEQESRGVIACLSVEVFKT